MFVTISRKQEQSTEGELMTHFVNKELKEMHMVRYADDFKIFCATRKDADRAYHATKAWLQERLKLEIGEREI